MPKIIYPIQYHEISPDETPIFLAGPIRGTRDWRAEAMELLSGSSERSLVFFSPGRLNDEKLRTQGQENWVSRQRQWEQYYLRECIKHNQEHGNGGALFYLEKQMKPLALDEAGLQKKAYGAITHIELGQVMVTHPQSIVVGIDGEYPERSTLVNDLRQSTYLDLSRPYDPLHLDQSMIVPDTLDETCARTKILLNL